MTAIRQSGKINSDTTLIDIGMQGVTGVTAVYLIQAEKTCLIDGGTRTEASRILDALKALNGFPPDIIIVTHSHYDHTQAVPLLQKEAAKAGKEITVMASHKAIPLLEDQSYNAVFKTGPYENVFGALPLKEGDTVDLGGMTLRIYETPGHHKDHIAILDEKNETIFVGDAIGYKVTDRLSIPPFVRPFWDPDAFYGTVEKLGAIPYQGLCLAHFGYVFDDEAKGILDEAVTTYETWWQLFDSNADRLDDADYMLDAVLTQVQPGPIETQILSTKLKVLLGLMTGWSKLTGKRPRPVGEFLLRNMIETLVDGYKSYQNP